MVLHEVLVHFGILFVLLALFDKFELLLVSLHIPAHAHGRMLFFKRYNLPF